MPRLIAIDAAGDAFVDAMRRAWDNGDAVVPVDPRLPPPARAALFDACAVGTAVEPGDALVIATSGTTGEPKGVVLTHDALGASARATNAALGVDPTADRWLACLPFSHIGGLSVVVRALVSSTPFEIAAPTDATACTLVSLVPTLLRRLNTSRFRKILVGGAPSPGDLPDNVVRTYGMTETGSGVVYDGHPLDAVELREVDGEVHVRGPMLLRCYRDGTDPKDANGWLATGDAGSLVDGVLRVHGRIGEVINTGGEKVWPIAVERALAECAGVGDVAVAGRADPEWGEVVVAYIVPLDEATAPALAAVREHVKASLPAYCAPREVVLVDALPRTTSGKVRRDLLV